MSAHLLVGLFLKKPGSHPPLRLSIDFLLDAGLFQEAIQA
jgi:hypothetical protein